MDDPMNVDPSAGTPLHQFNPNPAIVSPAQHQPQQQPSPPQATASTPGAVAGPSTFSTMQEAIAALLPTSEKMLCEDCREHLGKTVMLERGEVKSHRATCHQLTLSVRFKAMRERETYYELTRNHGETFRCPCGQFEAIEPSSMRSHCVSCTYLPSEMEEHEGKSDDASRATHIKSSDSTPSTPGRSVAALPPGLSMHMVGPSDGSVWRPWDKPDNGGAAPMTMRTSGGAQLQMMFGGLQVPGVGQSPMEGRRDPNLETYVCPKCRDFLGLNVVVLKTDEGRHEEEVHKLKLKSVFRDGTLRTLTRIHGQPFVCLCAQRFMEPAALRAHTPTCTSARAPAEGKVLPLAPGVSERVRCGLCVDRHGRIVMFEKEDLRKHHIAHHQLSTTVVFPSGESRVLERPDGGVFVCGCGLSFNIAKNAQRHAMSCDAGAEKLPVTYGMKQDASGSGGGGGANGSEKDGGAGGEAEERRSTTPTDKDDTYLCLLCKDFLGLDCLLRVKERNNHNQKFHRLACTVQYATGEMVTITRDHGQYFECGRCGDKVTYAQGMQKHASKCKQPADAAPPKRKRLEGQLTPAPSLSKPSEGSPDEHRGVNGANGTASGSTPVLPGGGAGGGDSADREEGEGCLMCQEGLGKIVFVAKKDKRTHFIKYHRNAFPVTFLNGETSMVVRPNFGRFKCLCGVIRQWGPGIQVHAKKCNANEKFRPTPAQIHGIPRSDNVFEQSTPEEEEEELDYHGTAQPPPISVGDRALEKPNAEKKLGPVAALAAAAKLAPVAHVAAAMSRHQPVPVPPPQPVTASTVSSVAPIMPGYVNTYQAATSTAQYPYPVMAPSQQSIPQSTHHPVPATTAVAYQSPLHTAASTAPTGYQIPTLDVSYRSPILDDAQHRLSVPMSVPVAPTASNMVFTKPQPSTTNAAPSAQQTPALPAAHRQMPSAISTTQPPKQMPLDTDIDSALMSAGLLPSAGVDTDEYERCHQCATYLNVDVMIKKGDKRNHQQKVHRLAVSVAFPNGDSRVLTREHGQAFVCRCGSRIDYPQNIIIHARKCNAAPLENERVATDYMDTGSASSLHQSPITAGASSDAQYEPDYPMRDAPTPAPTPVYTPVTTTAYHPPAARAAAPAPIYDPASQHVYKTAAPPMQQGQHVYTTAPPPQLSTYTTAPVPQLTSYTTAPPPDLGYDHRGSHVIVRAQLPPPMAGYQPAAGPAAAVNDDPAEVCLECRTRFGKEVPVKRSAAFTHQQRFHTTELAVKFASGGKTPQPSELPAAYQASVPPPTEQTDSPPDQVVVALNGDEELCDKCRVYLFRPGVVIKKKDRSEHNRKMHRLSITIRYPDGVQPGEGPDEVVGYGVLPGDTSKKLSSKRKSKSAEDVTQSVVTSASDAQPESSAMIDDSGDVIGEFLCEDCRDFLGKTVYITKTTRQAHRKRIHQLNCWVIYRNGVEEYLERNHGDQFKCFCGKAAFYVQSMQTHCRMCTPPEGYVPKQPDLSKLEKKGREKDDEGPRKKRRLAGLDLKKMEKKRNEMMVTDADRRDVLEQWLRIGHSVLRGVEEDLILPAARVEELIFEIAKEKKDEYHILAKYHLDMLLSLLRERPDPTAIRDRLLTEPLLPEGVRLPKAKGAIRQTVLSEMDLVQG
ncbi:hypothetical protein HK101_010689 [Irineochytrium annulatum]|nr:hypothetical protein HK101_010689 [Irineochytrium annulatum]